METLRAYLTPQAKKQRTHAIEEEAEDFDVEPDPGAEDEVDEDEDEPSWAKKFQKVLLTEMRTMLSPVMDTIEDLKKDMNNMKLETGLARVEAEEAMMQAGLAHGAAEEAANLAKNLDAKISQIQVSMLKLDDVKTMIDEAIRGNVQGGQSGRLDDASAKLSHSPEKLEKFKRTMVMGGFPDDSYKREVENKVQQTVAGATGVEEIYAYRRGSIGFVRFLTADDMWKYLKDFNATEEKSSREGKKLWAAVSRSPEDRKKRRTLSTYKNVLIDVGLAKAENVDYDSRRGLLWVGRCKVGIWNPLAEVLEIDEQKMKAAGISVGTKMLQDAVADAMVNK